MIEYAPTTEQAERYERATHAMQTGVKFDLETGGDNGSHKHLRVGVNSALVEGSAVAKLLMDKGVFTASEYFDAIIEAMEAEATRYTELLSQRFGTSVNLL